ncbi:hypothetical protein BDV28DRAFT_142061 [Aspergillus coremiiformis]|uniref:Uncharacterized protein n=1 Tax=Aspergillus coremiiformis TaxID=138285 RepID=A0A5N6YUC7_9EURO|nr:hypothetical protein BDV28DRAFT_142061 [Aspergillus coremiiformis]
MSFHFLHRAASIDLRWVCLYSSCVTVTPVTFDSFSFIITIIYYLVNLCLKALRANVE